MLIASVKVQIAEPCGEPLNIIPYYKMELIKTEAGTFRVMHINFEGDRKFLCNRPMRELPALLARWRESNFNVVMALPS